MEENGAFGRVAADALVSGAGLLTCCGFKFTECVEILSLYIVSLTDFKREYFSSSGNHKKTAQNILDITQPVCI